MVTQLSKSELLALAKEIESKRRSGGQMGPQTDDELHAWILEHTGMDIPRVAVCEGHASPFEFLADIYFERVTSAIVVANRGGAKTMISALLHLLNSKFKKGCESFTVGAILQQADRAYTNFKKLLMLEGKVDKHDDYPGLIRSVQKETIFEWGSKVEITPGTEAAVNGPHPHKVHLDEVELMDQNVFSEARNMSQSKDGIKAQDWITSTRKRAHGPMQALLNEVEEAKRVGADPPYVTYTWCVFETAAPVPNCQVANPDATQTCACERVVKGTWEDGSPRRFVDVCKGRLARSRGYITLDDIHKLFRNNTKETWEAQQECTKPETAGLVLPMFERGRYGLKWFDPDPDNGPIFIGVDFGGTNPHAVNWYQLINRDLKVYEYHQERSEEPRRTIRAGTLVCFDEVYQAEISNTQLATLIVNRNNFWRDQYPSFRQTKIFADPAARAARIEFGHHEPPLGTAWYCTRDQKEQIKTVKALFNENLFAVDTTRCPMFCSEAEDWHYPKKNSQHVYDPEIPVDDFNHCMAEFRYVVENIKVMTKKGLGQGQLRPQAGDPPSREMNVVRAGAPKYLPRENKIKQATHPFYGTREAV